MKVDAILVIFDLYVILNLTKHVLGVGPDIAGINHTILRLYFVKVCTNDAFFNYFVRWLGKWKVASGDKPWCFVMGESFHNFSAVTANIIYHAVIYSLFACRENLAIKRGGTLNGIEAIITIAKINVSINRPMHPCLTVFFKEKFFVKGIMKTLNIVKGFLEC